MAVTDHTTIAEVYAQALLDLAIERGVEAAIDQEFAEFAAYLKIETDFRAFFESQVIDRDARRESLDRMFQGKMSDLLLNALQVLNRKGRTALVREVQQRYHEMLLKHQGILEVSVSTADPLPESLRQAIQQLLESRTGKQIILIEHLNPELIGGLVLKMGDQKLDHSVARELQRFHQILVDHAVQHIHAGTNLFEGALEH